MSNMNLSDVPYHPEQRFACNGIYLAADSYGNPSHPAVLLIMGLATQLVYWDDDFCRLLASKGFWVVRFDNRDIGNSDALSHLPSPNLLRIATKHYLNIDFTPAYPLKALADDAIALLNALSIKSAHVFGVSMGGMVAQLMAIHYPDRVLSLTSIMSGTGDKSLLRPSGKVIWQIFRPFPSNRESVLRQSVQMWRVLHGDHFPFEHERIYNMLSKALQRGLRPAGVMRQFGAIMTAEDRAPQLQKLNLPCLVIHGDADPLVSVANGYATARAIPGAQLRIIKGMGHTIPVSIQDELIHHFCLLTRKLTA